MELKLELESTPDASGRAREELRWLEGRIGPRALSDLLLVITELITNSVKFGPGVQIDLRLDIHDDASIAGLVVDGGSGLVQIRDTEVTEPGGFGLRIVDQLSSDWGVRPGTSDVWFELQAGEGDGAQPATRRVRASASSAADRRRRGTRGLERGHGARSTR